MEDTDSVMGEEMRAIICSSRTALEITMTGATEDITSANLRSGARWLAA
jgi:hypothetical protein